MRASFDYDYTKSEYLVGLETLTAQLARTQPRGKELVLWQMLGAITLVLVLTGYLYPRAVTAVLLALVAMGMAEAFIRNHAARRVLGISYDPTVSSCRVAIDEDGVSEHCAGRTRQWDWSSVRGVYEQGSVVTVHVAGWDMIVLPKRLWTNAGEREQLLASMRDRAAAALDPSAEQPSPPVSHAGFDALILAPIAAAIDMFLVVSLLLPAFTRGYGPLAERTGIAGGMAIVLGLSAVLGYAAYRLTKAWLPQLHARSPLAAQAAAQLLIWAFAAWFVGAYFRWW